MKITFSKDGAVLANDKVVPSIHITSGDLSALLNQTFSPLTALAAIHKENLCCRLQPIAVIGPKVTTEQQYRLAENVGKLIADLGLPLLCGGGEGVMEAAAKGASQAGGTVIGLLHGEDPQSGNPYLSYVLPSGIGKARNALIAQSAACLVGIGGGHGTITEMAFGIHFGKRVFALEKEPFVPDVEYIDDISLLTEPLLEAYFSGSNLCE